MLPINYILPELLATLAQQNTVLLQAQPGAGKTTKVPLALLEQDWLAGNKILMLEPRRLAARSAASYMAKQLGEQAGQRVGYRTRLDSKISPATQIEVVTEGVLTRIIQRDPSLAGYAVVIFDEFHERSLQTDLGLALARQVQQLLREDLRLLLMSATLDTAPLASLLDDAPVLSCRGRSYPVELNYYPIKRVNLMAQLAACVMQVLAEQQGSLLVFLPGVGEIRQLSRLLEPQLASDTLLAPLYGSMPIQQQDLAIAPTPPAQRKIVLATSIAETSLTIEGISVVIDSGLQRRAVFDPNSGMSRLITTRVSQAAAEQRAGRAGRVQAGSCYRLWSATEQASLAKFEPAEILEADLSSLVLELALWGVQDAGDLVWLDEPPSAHWQQAQQLLSSLELLDSNGKITELGVQACNLGIHPRLAKMVLSGRKLGLGATAAQLAALLGERDLLDASTGADLYLRLQLLVSTKVPASLANRIKPIKQAAQRLADEKLTTVSLDSYGLALALAYPDRIARRRAGRHGHYQLSNGKGAYLREDDPLASEEWLVVADLDGNSKQSQIYLAAAVNFDQLAAKLPQLFTEEEHCGWDTAKGSLIAKRLRKLGQLVIQRNELAAPSSEQVAAALLAEIRKRGLASLPWQPEQQQWLARLALLRRELPQAWPELDENYLLQQLESWLLPYLNGINSWPELSKLRLQPALDALLSYQQQQELERLAPTKIAIPSGQMVTVDYCASGGPVVAAKLQALFGWQQTPSIIAGKVKLVLHLLSPANRPLAVTADLNNFWRNVYPQVRKDMRGRYPKHPWPEDALTASAPIAKGKAQLK